MKSSKNISIGKITKEQILKFDRKISRDEEINASTGWVAKHKIFRSDKTYNRKLKHSKRIY